jgi:hypothetical protein
MKRISINFIAVTAMLLMPSQALYSSNYQQVVISDDGNKYVTSRNEKTKLLENYRNTPEGKQQLLKFNTDKDCMSCHDPSINKKGNKATFTCSCGDTPSDDGYYKLIVVDTKTNKKIVSFKNGHISSFSPDGESLVFSDKVYGEIGTQAPPNFNGGIWIYNFYTKRKTRISKSYLGYFADLVWSKHDGNIYEDTSNGIKKYDVKAQKWVKTDYKGIYFSKDGKYYASAPSEDEAKIYRSSDNIEMLEWENLIKKGDKKALLSFQFWGYDLNILAVTSGSAYNNIFFDYQKGQIVGEFQGFCLGTNYNGSLMYVHPMNPDKKRYSEDKYQTVDLKKIIKDSK